MCDNNKSDDKMTCKTIKCVQCNIIINELLAFIQNKADVMDEEGIVRLCVSVFSSSEIEIAKNLLFDSIKTNMRKIARKKVGKEERDLYDIIALFKQTDAQKTPIFVARNLEKLPILNYDHVSPSRILKDLIRLQDNMKTVMDSYVTKEQLIELKNSLITQQQAPNCDTTNINVNKNRGACLTLSDCCDSGLQNYHTHGSSTPCPSIATEEVNSSNSIQKCNESPPTLAVQTEQLRVTLPSLLHERVFDTPLSLIQQSDNQPVDKRLIDKSEAAKNAITSLSVSSDKGRLPETVLRSTTGNRSSQYVDIVKKGGEWKYNEPTEEWKTVQRRRHRNRFIGLKGDAMVDSDCKFKAVDVKIPLLIYNVDKSTSIQDIRTYIVSKTNMEIQLECVQMTREKEYNSYKLFVPKRKLNIFMDTKFWPDGISFRRFVDFKYKKGTSTSTVKN